MSSSGTGHQLYQKAKTLIPGGTQLLSKRPEMFLPDGWPCYYSRAKGCEVWDLDGNRYDDFTQMGVGTCVLGYADDDVNEAVMNVICQGNMCTLNAPEEVALAELLLALHPWADMARYTRSGGEALSVAVRIARSYSKKDKIVFCGYHGWHDWYLSANLSTDTQLDGHLLPGLEPNGVPKGLLGSTIPFSYNHTEELIHMIETHRHEVGILILETVRNEFPDPVFVDTVNRLCHENQMVLIVDEVTCGFRLNPGGAHLLYGFEPDIAVFAKGISNGFPMGVVLGRRGVMQAAQTTFISSTYWTERIGPTAAITTIQKFIDQQVDQHLCQVGQAVRRIWQDSAKQYGVPISKIGGIEPLSHFQFDHPEPLTLKTLFTELMLKKGVLASTSLYSSYAHNVESLQRYEKAIQSTFEEMSGMLLNPTAFLESGTCHSGFKRLN